LESGEKAGWRGKAKSYQTWFVFFVALCSLLLLMLVPSLTTLNRTEAVYREIRAIQENYQRNQGLLDDMARDIYAVGLVIREFLLESSVANDREYVGEAERIRRQLQRQIAELRGEISGGETGALDRLEAELTRYWEPLLPIFEWTPQQRLERGTYFLREQQRPRRQSLLAITSELERLNAVVYRQQYQRLNDSEKQFRGDVKRVVQFVFLAGLLVTVASILRIRWLERKAQEQREQAVRTGQELRNLSTRLRNVQEEERKTISRELHDEVGQKLTALRMEVGGLERLRNAGDNQFGECLSEVKGLAEQSLRTIRDMAAGLRPSLLDDLGLGPAIQRHAREFARHTGQRVTVEIEGDLEALPEPHRINVYRIVQEGLTNCARHARAASIRVHLCGSAEQVAVAVSDDGVGFDASVRTGLGLIGIEERVRELGGSVAIQSRPGEGTKVQVVIPVNGSR
jgi:signal transduction histidine kinase